jgi:hypothetical protein
MLHKENNMIEFYKKMAEDLTISEEERENYRKMYEKMIKKDGIEELKAKLKEDAEKDLAMAEKDDDDCAGCKI